MQKQLQKKRKRKERKRKTNEPTLMKMRNRISFQRETIYFNTLVNISSSVHNVTVKEKKHSPISREKVIYFLRNPALESF